MQSLDRSSFVSTKWRNGGGATLELFADKNPNDTSPGLFSWRLSVATISKSGPFSEFEGYHRTIVALAGGPVRLIHKTSATLLAPLVPYEFDGGDAPQGILEGPEATDFNVFVAKAWARAEVTVHRGAHKTPVTPTLQRALFLWQGTLSVQDGRGALTVPAPHLLIWGPRENPTVTLDAKAIAVDTILFPAFP